MKSSISICIPTFQRPKFLKEALDSVMEQSLQPVEIVIGDDSNDDVTEKLILNIKNECKIPIFYTRHSPSLGQAENINFLYKAAQGDKIVLLHDDDLLLPTSLEDLDSCWDLHPSLVAAYGKQYFISEEGTIDLALSSQLNQIYFRASDNAGLQKSSLAAAVLHQFPNDGFMLLASAAKAIKLRFDEEVGNAVDFDFGLRLGFKYENFFFLDKYTAKCRSTENSITGNNNDDSAFKTFYLIQNTDFPADLIWAKEHELKRQAVYSIIQLINCGRKKEALDIYFSKYYPLSKRLSIRGIRRLLKALLPRSIEKFI